ncbi:BTB/POZ domain-containing protein [Aphelenchoides fujianensis]|nr:BTB/POZ domain-containing protein [Aphelenchoides fujianensis]
MDVLQRGLGEAFNDGIHWDFVVQVRDVEYKVLKLIVGIHSEVFQRMFAANMREAEEGRVKITGYKPKAVGHALRFCYTGELKAMKLSRLLEVYRVAHYFRVLSLIDVCRKRAVNEMDTSNVLQWLEIAFKYDDECLQHYLLFYVVEKNEEIRALPEFAAFFEQHPSIALAMFRRMADDRNMEVESRRQREQQAAEQRVACWSDDDFP